MEHEIEVRTMHMQSTISAQPALLLSEPQLAKLIHKEFDAQAGSADHLGQRFLNDLGNDRLRPALLPKVSQYQQRSRQPRFAGIKQLTHQFRLDADPMHQQIGHEHFAKPGLFLKHAEHRADVSDAISQ
jgi:hypothetical protein